MSGKDGFAIDIYPEIEMGFSRKKFLGVLWDIDGSLIDSEPLHDEAVLAVLKDMGLERSNQNLDMLGTTWDQTWQTVGGKPEALPEFKRKISAYYLEKLSGLKPRSIAVELVHKFHGMGIRQAAVSNSGRNICEANLKHLDIFDKMEIIVSRNDCIMGKPDPEPYLNAAKKLGLDIRACIAIEDSPRGAQSAKEAGALTLFWPQDQALITEYCDLKISELSDFEWHDYLGDVALSPAKEPKP